jgi:4-hydroxy-3-polyprenylbenzoate decarboxylase
MDFRNFIEQLNERGQLRRVNRQVDWKYELGEMTRGELTPLLFENIKDYPGHRVFTNGLINIPAIGIALGVEAGISRKELIRQVRKRVAIPIAPTRVQSGPILQNILEREEVDLLKLPVPHWNRCDGGRYIGTWHVNISRDPENGSHNLGVYRMQVLGPKQATISTSSKSHLGIQFAKAEAMGRPLEVAVAIGVSEAVCMAAAAGYPCGKDEYELAGALQEKSVPLIKCPSIDVDAPADAEILIEGHVLPGVRVLDGPYFDYAGKATSNPKAYLFEATRMMFRNNPIFRGAIVGHPRAEDLQLFSVLSEVGLFDFHGSRLKRALQILFLKEGLFRAFQFAGRIGPGMLRFGLFHGKDRKNS